MDTPKRQHRRTTVSNAVDTALTPFRAAVSKPAQKAYLGTALFTTTSFLLLALASLAFWLFYYSYVPQPAIERVVWLQFGNGHPHGTALFSGALVSNQAYDISIILHLPRTSTNLEAGNFMLDLALLPSVSPPTLSSYISSASVVATSDPIARSRRPSILTYISALTDTASTLTSLPLYILGLSSESEILTIPMFEGAEFAKGAANVPQAAKLIIEADEKMQFYEARLRIIAKLRGLRWMLYNHRILSFLVFTTSFWCSSIVSMSIVWLFLSIYLSTGTDTRRKVVKKEDSETNDLAIKLEPTPDSEIFDPTSLEDISDTSRTFPTFGRQKPLRYSPSEVDPTPFAKREQREDALVQPLVATAAEADDEDDFEDAGVISSAWRDSGIGTSLEEERRAGVQRRRKAGMGGGNGR